MYQTKEELNSLFSNARIKIVPFIKEWIEGLNHLSVEEKSDWIEVIQCDTLELITNKSDRLFKKLPWNTKYWLLTDAHEITKLDINAPNSNNNNIIFKQLETIILILKKILTAEELTCPLILPYQLNDFSFCYSLLSNMNSEINQVGNLNIELQNHYRSRYQFAQNYFIKEKEQNIRKLTQNTETIDNDTTTFGSNIDFIQSLIEKTYGLEKDNRYALTRWFWGNIPWHFLLINIGRMLFGEDIQFPEANQIAIPNQPIEAMKNSMKLNNDNIIKIMKSSWIQNLRKAESWFNTFQQAYSSQLDTPRYTENLYFERKLLQLPLPIEQNNDRKKQNSSISPYMNAYRFFGELKRTIEIVGKNPISPFRAYN